MLVAAYRLDGARRYPHKHRLGGNAIYSTSIALLRAAAMEEGLPAYAYVKPARIDADHHRAGDELQDDQRRTQWRANATVHEFIVTPYRADLLVEQNAQAAFSLANYG